MTETNQSLDGRAVLLAPDDTQNRELTVELTGHGARVITCPKVEIIDPESFVALDEAIRNLFGYDWLIFANINAAGFFLRRLRNLGHEISEMDTLRVCAVDEATRQQLEESHVHVDLVSETLATDGVAAALEAYNGGGGSLSGLNFLVPRAASSRDRLRQTLEDAGARVDVVAAYRTAGLQNSELVQLSVLLEGGGIDCVVFTTSAEVGEFAALFDTNDLSRLLEEVAVACLDRVTTQSATTFGLRAQITPAEAIPELARAIASYFSKGHTQPA